VLHNLRARDAAVTKDRVNFYTTEEQKAIRERGPFWDAQDSSLENGDNSWGAWFKEVIPTGERLKEHVETALEPLTERVGLELGGPGSQLFSDFPPGFFVKSIGVCLTDPRLASFDRFDKLDRDALINHSVIPGNFLDPATIQAVDAQLDGRKAAFIGERLFSGVVTLPQDPFALAANASIWYERLAEGGLMLAQIPPGLQPLADEWRAMTAVAAPALNIQIGTHAGYGLIRIHKQFGSPDTLPLISARTMMERRNESRNFRL
jgi:hypothetical protein